MFRFLVVLLAACTPFTPVKDMECSEAEQEMFLVCVTSGCNAEYTQDLKDEDACSIEGGGSIVSVKGGSECAFTATGSCYVLCDCPEGVEATYVIEETVDFEGDQPSDCSDGADNDKDGLFDCADSDCSGAPICQEEPVEDSGGFVAEDTALPGEEAVEDTTDFDRDGFVSDDCNDRNSAINPEATDIVGDAIDQNCDGIDGLDVDRDGFASASSGGTDCDDYNFTINPDYGMVDVHDTIDSNCDGLDGLSETYKALEFDFDVRSAYSGNFDGDGLDDLVIEGYDWSTRTTLHCLFYGTTLSTISGYLHLEDADVVIHSLDDRVFFISDLDEDGYDDIIASSGGSLYIFKGITISISEHLIPEYNDDAKYYSTDSIIDSAVVANDWNSDGSKELIVNDYSFEVSSSWTDNRVHSLLPPSSRILGIPLEAGDSDFDGYIDYFSLCYISGRGYPCLRDYNTPTSSYLQIFYTFRPEDRMEDTDGDGYPEVGNGNCFQNVNSISDDTSCDVYWAGPRFEKPFYFDGDATIDLVTGNRIHLSSTGRYVDYTGSIYSFGDFNGDGENELVSANGIVGIR